MELETITERDEFGNFTTDRYDCPRCGHERVVYVFQFDSWMCERVVCEWVEGGGLLVDDHEPLREPKREKRPWREVWPEIAENASIGVRWARGEPVE